MEKESRIEEIAKEADKREKVVNDYVNEFSRARNIAYESALEEIGGKVSALEDEDTHEEFVEAYIDKLLEIHDEKHGRKFKEDGEYHPLEKKNAFRYLSGVSTDQLKSLVKKHKGDFTEDVHAKLKDEHTKQLKQQSLSYIVDHIDIEDKDVIMEETGYDKHPDTLNENKLKQLYLTHRQREDEKMDQIEELQYGTLDNAA